jgi:hypothetical protein
MSALGGELLQQTHVDYSEFEILSPATGNSAARVEEGGKSQH